jgi:hypothetical protein
VVELAHHDEVKAVGLELANEVSLHPLAQALRAHVGGQRDERSEGQDDFGAFLVERLEHGESPQPTTLMMPWTFSSTAFMSSPSPASPTCFFHRSLSAKCAHGEHALRQERVARHQLGVAAEPLLAFVVLLEEGLDVELGVELLRAQRELGHGARGDVEALAAQHPGAVTGHLRASDQARSAITAGNENHCTNIDAMRVR